MSKRKKILLMLAKGGVSQADVVSALQVSKRDVSSCAKLLRERGLAFDQVSAMGAAEVQGTQHAEVPRREEAGEGRQGIA